MRRAASALLRIYRARTVRRLNHSLYVSGGATFRVTRSSATLRFLNSLETVAAENGIPRKSQEQQASANTEVSGLQKFGMIFVVIANCFCADEMVPGWGGLQPGLGTQHVLFDLGDRRRDWRCTGGWPLFHTRTDRGCGRRPRDPVCGRHVSGVGQCFTQRDDGPVRLARRSAGHPDRPPPETDAGRWRSGRTDRRQPAGSLTAGQVAVLFEHHCSNRPFPG